jgi:ADP-heptose:LPS heptosyltransferase
MNFGDKVRLGIVRAADRIRRGTVSVLSGIVFRRFSGDPDSVRRIVIFRIGNVGDVAAATPVLAAIRRRFPNAYICLLTSPGAKGAPGAAEMIQPGSLVDSLLVYYKSDIATWEGRKRLLRQLRNEGFEMFIELSNILSPFRQVLQSMALARMAGCHYAVGLRLAGCSWFPRTQALHVPFLREPDRLWETVGPVLGLGPNESVPLPVSDADRAHVGGLLEQKGLTAKESLVVMHVGAKRAANRWFEERYAAVADWLQRERGLRVVFTGALSDVDQVERVLRQMRSEAIPVCGQLSLLQTAALLERAVLYVGNDTGPMHIAAAMGTPAVAIFSARDYPRQWYPYGEQHFVIRRDVPCSPCFLDECDRGLICLERIQVNDVIQAIQAQLVKSGAARMQAAAGSREVNCASE